MLNISKTLSGEEKDYNWIILIVSKTKAISCRET